LLAAGYLESQVATLNGTAADWAAKADRPPVAMLATFLLVISIILGFVKDQEAE